MAISELDDLEKKKKNTKGIDFFKLCMYGKTLSVQWSHIIDDESMFTIGTMQAPTSENV